MNIFKVFGDAVRYLYEGATGLFSPDRDQYPNIGVQPFSGDPYSEWVSPAEQKSK
jgi:hypothetical protein